MKIIFSPRTTPTKGAGRISRGSWFKRPVSVLGSAAILIYLLPLFALCLVGAGAAFFRLDRLERFCRAQLTDEPENS